MSTRRKKLKIEIKEAKKKSFFYHQIQENINREENLGEFNQYMGKIKKIAELEY